MSTPEQLAAGYIGQVRDQTPNSTYTVAGQVGRTANADDPPNEAAAERVRAAWAPLSQRTPT